VLANGSNFWSVSIEEPDVRHECASDEIHLLFGGATDLASIEGNRSRVVAMQFLHF